MKIGIIAPIAERIPPKKYGGTERVLYTLTEELVKRGHEVTLFASGDSVTSAKLASVFPASLRESGVKDIYGFNLPSMLNMAMAYARQDEFDIIHDHHPHMGLPAGNIARTPVVMTWHGPYSEEIIDYVTKLNRPYRTSISLAQAQLAQGVSFIANVYNGLYMEHYPFAEQPEDYLLFVARVDMEKGLHIAMDVAGRLQKRLKVCAKYDSEIPLIRHYYETEIEPRLQKYGELIEWIGEVNEQQRNDLMKSALCLLHPITWPEPFGLTLIEAMSCGCPVVAFHRGSIPEIIVDGTTGFIVENIDEMAEAVGKIGQLDRLECRRHSLTNFNAQKMADGYEAVYQKILEETKA